MSMISSMFGRRPNHRGPRGDSGGAGDAVMEPVSIDILEPLIDAISLTAFSTAAAAPPGVAGMGMSPFSTASMDWKETAGAHVFITDLPGVLREEVKIEVEEEKILKISGQRARAAEDKGDKWHRVERGTDRFFRTVRLPPNANADGVQASLENGVLTVTVPKDQDKRTYGRLIPVTN